MMMMMMMIIIIINGIAYRQTHRQTYTQVILYHSNAMHCIGQTIRCCSYCLCHNDCELQRPSHESQRWSRCRDGIACNFILWCRVPVAL